MTRNGSERPLFQRLAWFAGLWLAGVATLFVIASLIRWAIL
ncbi:DUF2474 family protein [Stappia indica]|uniref:DUF2474 domain-containing protein n=1 Tax=Stappia indica TaxID=538381 RepID=A0A285TC70_9HYPH|nr:DUF2474 family protein [Stappia indica]SOC19530.1 Protein of unknown function [Stappia indica]